MIALAASAQRPPRRSRDQPVHDAGELRRIERLADHAGRGEKDFASACSRRPRAASFGGQLRRFACRFLPVKALALPELTTSARAVPPPEMRAAPVDRRRRAFGAREHAGHRRARVEQRQQQVGAARVPDARRGGGEAHARDRRQAGTDFGASGETVAMGFEHSSACPVQSRHGGQLSDVSRPLAATDSPRRRSARTAVLSLGSRPAFVAHRFGSAASAGRSTTSTFGIAQSGDDVGLRLGATSASIWSFTCSNLGSCWCACPRP